MALVHTQGSAGDRSGAMAAMDDARRTFDAVGTTNGEINDFEVPEWRMAHITSRMASRLGEERLAVEAQDTVARTLPATLPWLTISVELHRALLMVRAGDRAGGLAYAQDVLVKLPAQGRRTPYGS
jgi:hypothetical protein